MYYRLVSETAQAAGPAAGHGAAGHGAAGHGCAPDGLAEDGLAEDGLAEDGQVDDAKVDDAKVDDAKVDVAAGLMRLTTLVQGIYARVSERHDLTPVQARLLCVLLDGPRGMAELAHSFGVEKAALTGLMDRAERRGLARRSPVPGDRRALQVTLTDAGHRTAAAFHAAIRAELTSLTSSLAPPDREHFRNAIAEIITGYQAPCSAGHC